MTSIRCVALLALFALAGCDGGKSAGGGAKREYPYKVAATVGMVADIVRQVAGDKAEVTGIIGSGVDPHSYNPTRGDVSALLRSDVVFYSGLMLEGRMETVLSKVGRWRPVFAVTAGIPGEYLLYSESLSHSDPHVWMDVGGWMKAVEAVADDLADFDAPNAERYRANAAAYLERLKRLDDYARRVLGSIPEGRRVMITAHDAFNYMARAYGLEVVGIQGLSTESEAGLKDINRIVDLIVSRNVPAVFVETSVSNKNVKALIEGAAARGRKVRIGGSLFSDAMGPPGTYEGTYIGMIDHNVTTIARALGGEAPERGMNGKLAVEGE